MLEIFGIISLCKLNKRNAIARGRRPGLFIALTIILWVGMELLGFFIGSFLEIEYGTVFIAYGFAGLGALGSFLIAKFVPKGNYVDPNSNPVVMNNPNDPMLGAYNVPIDQTSYAPYPNAPAQGIPVDQYGMPVNTQLNEFGMPVDENGNYKPVLNQYGVPIDPTAVNAPQPVYQAQPSPAAPVPTAPAQAAPILKKFCGNCGAPIVDPGSSFCDSCGSKL